MASDWLYPLSSSSGYTFLLQSGKSSTDTGPASFEQMIIEGAVDDDWVAYKNWKNLEKKDRVWVYYGHSDGDIGVVGLGQVKSVKKPSKQGHRAIVKIIWDAAKTKKLLKHPFPAKSVRKHIPKPQGALWRIEPALARQLANHSGNRSNPSPTSSRTPYANGKTSTITYTRPKTVKVHRRHDALLRPLIIRLQSNGWEEVKVNVQSKRVDLAMELGKQMLIVEAKTVNSSTSQEVRAAFAQLKEYAWRLHQGRNQSHQKVILWALLEKEPTPDEIRFLEDHSVLISWATHQLKRIVHSQKTALNPAIRSLGN